MVQATQLRLELESYHQVELRCPGAILWPLVFKLSMLGWTQAEIGEFVGRSQNRVSEILSEITESVKPIFTLHSKGYSVVSHRQNPELVGRIVSLDSTSARIELLTWPTAWWRRWGNRPVPVLVEYLERVE